MSHLINDIAKYLKFDQTNIDNWVFKLFYKGCFILFLMGSMVGILSQYFGDPINCDFKGLDKHLANDYCWIHGSPYIPHGQYQYQRHIMKCIVEFEDLKEDKDNVPYTAYYQVIHLTLVPYCLISS